MCIRYSIAQNFSFGFNFHMHFNLRKKPALQYVGLMEATTVTLEDSLYSSMNSITWYLVEKVHHLAIVVYP